MGPATPRGSLRVVVNNLYFDEAEPAEAQFAFSPDIIEQALQRIYSPDFDPKTDIEPSIFQELWRDFNEAADKGIEESRVNVTEAFRQALRHSNAVFSAFKTHRLQNDMAALLLDSDGNLKPFEQWRKDVIPIASHQCGHWLRTEYDTAVIRAHQAADWQQFQAEKDVLPNLRWVPSTSPNPGADHMPFWNTVLPVDHSFWGEHRPGDRWNCKCSLSSTDQPATPVPQAPDKKSNPQPGLDNNPGKDAKLFSDKHPYIKEAYPGAKRAVDKIVRRIEEMIAEMPENLTRDQKIAIAQNNLELEKSLGKKGKPMTTEQADKQNANPDYGKGRGFGINCQTCSPAFLLRSRGFNITAKPRPETKIVAYEIWKNADGTDATFTHTSSWMKDKGYARMTATRYKEFFEETCREEGIYEIMISWKGIKSRHATILQRFKDGTLRYVEPQVDNSEGSKYQYRDFNWLCENLKAIPYVHRGYLDDGVMRIDDKVLDSKYAESFLAK